MRRRMLFSLLCASLVSTLPMVSAEGNPATPKKATVQAPGYRVLQRLAKQGSLRFRAHGKGKALGGARFIEAVSAQKPRAAQLIIVEKVSGEWRLRRRLKLQLRSKPDKRCDPCDPSGSNKTAAVVFVRDYDGDGKLEAYARTITCWSQPAIGPTTFRSMELWNLDGAPQRALRADYGYNALPTAAGAKHVRARFVDANGDGHPDVVLSDRQELPGRKTTRSKRVYLWSAKTDSYAPRRRRKRR